MRVHAIQTGRVQITASQIVGRGHGFARQAAPLFDSQWSDWLPVNAYGIEHRDGVVLVDTGASVAAKSCPAGIPTSGMRCASTSSPSTRRGRSSRRSAFDQAT